MILDEIATGTVALLDAPVIGEALDLFVQEVFRFTSRAGIKIGAVCYCGTDRAIPKYETTFVRVRDNTRIVFEGSMSLTEMIGTAEMLSDHYAEMDILQ